MTMRSPALVLLGLTAAGLVTLALFPSAALAMGGLLVLAGAVVLVRGDRPLGIGIAATGVTLFLVAVLVLAVVDAHQDEPVILGPDSGLTPGG